MATVQTESWIQKLTVGTMDVSDLAALEQLRKDDILNQLLPLFPHHFLNHRRKDKSEVGMAKNLHRTNGNMARYKTCIILTFEKDHITTMAWMKFLRIRPARNRPGQFELFSGAGLSLYRDPDGWKIKWLEEATVILSRETLQTRWNLLDSKS